ncbi:MAG: response regulator [Candidatus Eisenbacteria bacterium]|uniref:Response regulator n=1 Tax=Eiseniibacteriota bacterium TaxID=2212470 RepID=A0A538UA69_UNCEI|nr:MAG: response regulator [Candidatus Eisenbacteria bacterium]
MAAARADGGMTTERPVRVLIADDEPRARQFLEKLLGEHEDIETVGSARGGVEALELTRKLAPDVVFLDIHMPDLSGLEVARHIVRDRAGPLPFVVFVTAYDRYAVEAFEVAALDYVLKPLKRERLSETLRRVVAEVRDGQPNANAKALRAALDNRELRDRLPPLKRLPVRHRREVKLLDLAEVPIVFSRDRLVLARAEGKEYLVDYTLQELEQRLPREQFVRVHRGALVNLDAIESYGGEGGVLVLRLKDGTRVEASERRAAEVRRRLR